MIRLLHWPNGRTKDYYIQNSSRGSLCCRIGNAVSPGRASYWTGFSVDDTDWVDGHETRILMVTMNRGG